MQGDATVITHLNAVLKNEMTAINQYFLHARMLEHWGVAKLGAYEYDELIDEMKHADMLIKRILFLGGVPRLEFDKLLIGTDRAGGPRMRSAARAAGDAPIARGDPLLRKGTRLRDPRPVQRDPRRARRSMSISSRRNWS